MFSGIWQQRSGSGSGYPGINHVQSTLVTPPILEPVSVTQLKLHARIPYDTEDAVLNLYVQAARETVERYLRRALITQTWDITCDWGPSWIELPWPNLQAVTGVYTTSLDNIEVTVPTTTYIVNVPTNFVGLNIGNVWPLHRARAGFRIRYVSGYGDAASSVPATIRRHILALAANMDNLRDEPVMSQDSQSELRPYRIEGDPFRLAKGRSREDLLA